MHLLIDKNFVIKDQALAKAGTDKSKILEATIWLADMDAAYHDMNKVYDSWIIPGKPPCRACVQVKLSKSSLKLNLHSHVCSRIHYCSGEVGKSGLSG